MKFPLTLAAATAVMAHSATFAAESATPPTRPNVIIVLSDDHGYGDLGITGNPILQTPNLDTFAREGIRLENFHVNAVCSPTRAAIMTGRYAERVGVTSCQSGIDILREGEVTLADAFRHNGYRTGLFGKWHLGGDYPYRPIDRGFDVWFGKHPTGTGHAGDYWNNDRANDICLRNGKREEKPRPGYETDILFDEAMSFIRQEKSKPFFVCLPTYAGHGPFSIGDPKWLEPYRGKATGDLADFYAMMTHFDQNFGRLREFLKTEGLADNTILIFFGDNGTSLAEAAQVFNGGMRGKKGSGYEGGHRVFCALRWPNGKILQPAAVKRLTHCMDLFPTLTDLCGLQLHSPIEFDGTTIRPLLENPAAQWPDRTLIAGFCSTHDYAVMTDRWRLCGKHNTMNQLFDLAADPGQKTDVAKIYPDVLKTLQTSFQQYYSEVTAETKGWNARPIIGSPHQETTVLNPMEWHDNSTAMYHQGAIAAGKRLTGFWLVRFAETASYRFEVRRWPAGTDAPITGVPAPKTDRDAYIHGKPLSGTLYGNIQPKALPTIARVRLKVGDTVQDKAVAANAVRVEFVLPVTGGPSTITASFLDKDGKMVCGGYYVSVGKETPPIRK